LDWTLYLRSSPFSAYRCKGSPPIGSPPLEWICPFFFYLSSLATFFSSSFWFPPPLPPVPLCSHFANPLPFSEHSFPFLANYYIGGFTTPPTKQNFPHIPHLFGETFLWLSFMSSKLNSFFFFPCLSSVTLRDLLPFVFSHVPRYPPPFLNKPTTANQEKFPIAPRSFPSPLFYSFFGKRMTLFFPPPSPIPPLVW